MPIVSPELDAAVLALRTLVDADARAAASQGSAASAPVLRPHAPSLRRGRRVTRSASPAAARRRSRATLSPPTSPGSPTSVLPSSSSSKELLLLENFSISSPESASAEAARALAVLAPDRLIPELSQLRPPGYGSSATSGTPPFISAGTMARTPASSMPCSDNEDPLAPLFTASQGALLSTPASTPPIRPCNRRKTMAGLTICRYSVRRSSARIKARRKAAPVAQMAEALVCCNLGIIKDGEVVTGQALAELSLLFKDQMKPKAMAGIRKLFKVDTDEDDALDDALINQGGAAALDHDGEAADVLTGDV